VRLLQEIAADIGGGEEDIAAEIDPDAKPTDFRLLIKLRAIEQLSNNSSFNKCLDQNGIPWGIVLQILKDSMPESIQDRDHFARSILVEAMEAIVGQKDVAWYTTRRASRTSGKEITWMIKGRNPQFD
jgi:hypothetical protein